MRTAYCVRTKIGQSNLRYHGTPKLTMSGAQLLPCFQKIHFCRFQIDIIQTSLLQKVSEKRLLVVCPGGMALCIEKTHPPHFFSQ